MTQSKTQKFNIILIIFLLIGINPQINSEEKEKEMDWHKSDSELMQNFKEYCPGGSKTLLEQSQQLGMNFCASYQLSKELDDLQVFLEYSEVKKLHYQLSNACAKALDLYKRGSMYPMIVARCQINIIDYLLHQKEHGVKGGNASYLKNLNKSYPQLILEIHNIQEKG